MIIPILTTSIIITNSIYSIGIRNEKLPSNTVNVIETIPKVITKIHSKIRFTHNHSSQQLLHLVLILLTFSSC